MIIGIVFISCDNKTINRNHNHNMKANNILQIDSDSYMDTDEFVLFWTKFRKSLLTNDTSTCSNLIDDKLNGYCSSLLDISNINMMDFKKDSTITKKRFIKEFKNSLNPVYVELIKDYNIIEDIKPVRTLQAAQNRYHRLKTVKKNTYCISTYLAREYKNDKVFFNLSYMNDDLNDETKNISLIFYKKNGEIKLCEIDFYYTYVDE